MVDSNASISSRPSTLGLLQNKNTYYFRDKNNFSVNNSKNLYNQKIIFYIGFPVMLEIFQRAFKDERRIKALTGLNSTEFNELSKSFEETLKQC
jgi:hypothetical protein